VVEKFAKALVYAGAVINDGRERGDDDEGAKSVFDSIGVMDNVQHELSEVLARGFPAPGGFLPAVRRLPAVLPFPVIGDNPAIGDVLVVRRCPAFGLGPAIRPWPLLCH